ncbi:MAG: hypothetical protein Q4A75_08995 [Peptostreptococcaceae bacterium]|nr:hypothetical protein [Peptostreptococcaceae bacterium]
MEIQKTITLDRATFALINSYAKKYGMSFSEAIGHAAVSFIQAYEDGSSEEIHIRRELESRCGN